MPVAQSLISSSDKNIRSAALWADHQWNAEWLNNPTRLSTFISITSTHPPGMTLPRTAWVRLKTASAAVPDVPTPVYTNGEWPLLPLVSVAQKNRPLTMLSFTVQSIDHFVECIVWRFCMTRQSEVKVSLNAVPVKKLLPVRVPLRAVILNLGKFTPRGKLHLSRG